MITHKKHYASTALPKHRIINSRVSPPVCGCKHQDFTKFAIYKKYVY